jgi:16S rRNA (guanine966-N2)-methyltransferase
VADHLPMGNRQCNTAQVGRIIAGAYKGHRLQSPPSDVARPTTDRVRESVFAALTSWLGRGDLAGDSPLAGISFLDLYAGTGAVGLEALSRGARPVHLVERDPRVAAVAVRNAAALKGGATVTRAAALSFLAAQPAAPYDVVWLDPPYDVPSTDLVPVLEAVATGGWLVDDGIVLVERSARSEALDFPAEFTDVWKRRYGETDVWFATRGG